MSVTCSSCGKDGNFRKTDDLKTVLQAAWTTYGFNINKNDYNYHCPECSQKLPDNIKKILNIS